MREITQSVYNLDIYHILQFVQLLCNLLYSCVQKSIL
jgi:hypothetical protein